MVMMATVLRVEAGGLLVRDMATGQEVYVHTNMARQFRAGDVVKIHYNGIMTPSIPPQISAQAITRVSQSWGCAPDGCWPGGCQSGGCCHGGGSRPGCCR